MSETTQCSTSPSITDAPIEADYATLIEQVADSADNHGGRPKLPPDTVTGLRRAAAAFRALRSRVPAPSPETKDGGA